MAMFPLGGIVALAVLLPNLLAVIYPPTARLTDNPPSASTRLQILTIIERIGQAGCFIVPFFYRLPPVAVGVIPLAVMLVCLVLYYAGWMRYLVRGRAEAWFYRPLLGIPLPMVFMPVLYFLAASAYLGSIWLALAALVLGVGHISVSWLQGRKIK
jgi:hypothetical protein